MDCNFVFDKAIVFMWVRFCDSDFAAQQICKVISRSYLAVPLLVEVGISACLYGSWGAFRHDKKIFLW